jgi:predicted transcriptional regulator
MSRNASARYLRDLIAAAGHSQVSAAKAIGISPRSMRRYVSTSRGVYREPPRPVVLALEALSK